MTNPHPHPLPPEDFDDRKLPLLEYVGPFFRIHKSRRAVFDCPRVGDGRFDSTAGNYSCAYSGKTFDCSFVETALWDTGTQTITTGWLRIRTLTIFSAKRNLQFVDLTSGPSLVRLGADAELSSSRDRNLTKPWSQAIWNHPQKVDGIAYLARHDPGEIAYAIFDRTYSAIEIENQYGMYEQYRSGELNRLIEKYSVSIIDD